MPRQNTIVLVYRDEIEQFAMLMNQGLPLDTLIHLTFKKDEEIITYLKEGMCLQEIFTRNQKKLYFKYLRILSGKLNLSDALDCVNKIEKSSNTFFETLLKKISYPFLFIDLCVLYDSILFRLCPCSNERLHFKWNGICVYPSIKVGFWIYNSIDDLLFVSLLCIVL